MGKSISVCKLNNYPGTKRGGDRIGCIAWYDDDACNERPCVHKYFCDLHEDYLKPPKGCLCHVLSPKPKTIDHKGRVYGSKKVGHVIDFCHVHCPTDTTEPHEPYKHDIKDGTKRTKEPLNLY